MCVQVSLGGIFWELAFIYFKLPFFSSYNLWNKYTKKETGLITSLDFATIYI